MLINNTQAVGMKTAARIKAMAMTGRETSSMAFKVACFGERRKVKFERKGVNFSLGSLRSLNRSQGNGVNNVVNQGAP